MHSCGFSAERDDLERRGNRSRRLVVHGICIPPMRSVAEKRKLTTHTDVDDVEEEKEKRQT